MRKRIIIALVGIGLLLGGAGAAASTAGDHAVAGASQTHVYG